MSDLLWPLPVEYQVITTEYGAVDAEHPASQPHRGIDIAAPLGVGVLAVDNGYIVVIADNAELGNHVVLRSSVELIDYLYCHLSKVCVRMGQMVARGQVLGLVGSTGFSTGPHLHFGQWQDGVVQEPKLIRPT